jgi:hypothetical protein
MEWLKKETEEFRKTMHLLEEMEMFMYMMSEENNNNPDYQVVLKHAFFSEEDYQEKKSHQEAAMKMMEQIDSRNPSKAIYDTELELMSSKQITLEEFFALGTQEEMESAAYHEGISLTPSYYDPVTKKMFIQANEHLFSDKKNLIVYQWENNNATPSLLGAAWSGAVLWTVYDPEIKQFTVIASTLDQNNKKQEQDNDKEAGTMQWLEEETENFKKTMKLFGEMETLMHRMSDENNNNPDYQVVLNYAFFSEEDYQEKKSHQEAAKKMIERVDSWNASKSIYDTELDLMSGKRITLEKLFAMGTQEERESTAYYKGLSLTPSYYDPVTKKVFIQANEYLFSDKKNLIIYQWEKNNTNPSPLGANWFGAVLWTVYDPEINQFTVIASTLDRNNKNQDQEAGTMQWLEEETEHFRKTMIEKKVDPQSAEGKIKLEYTLFSEENYREEESHREAAIKTIEVLNGKRFLAPKKIVYTDARYFRNPNFSNAFVMPHDQPYAVNPELMYAKRILPKDFFELSNVSDPIDTTKYSYVFLDLFFPYSPTMEEFENVNNYLFPNKDNLIIYQWNNDWSNYFTAGKDGWAAAMWTVYDPERNKFTVASISIGPSGE